MTTIHHKRTDEPDLVNRLVLWLPGSFFSPLLDKKICAPRYTAVAFPVQYARIGDRVLVVAGNPEHKRLRRHFRNPAPLESRGPASSFRGTVSRHRRRQIFDSASGFPRPIPHRPRQREPIHDVVERAERAFLVGRARDVVGVFHSSEVRYLCKGDLPTLRRAASRDVLLVPDTV
ncbi:hypothetical protein [Amycolatopsis sp. NPDC059657]|uniref:hypothetical protein n=1 Tax=Amycolatopsis sp. NPDC059657 TaxID=3346899 RepID=UPI003670D4DB